MTNTAIRYLKFKLGNEYKSDMFMGDYIIGNLYHFEATRNMRDLNFEGPLIDKIASKASELCSPGLAKVVGRITDIFN